MNKQIRYHEDNPCEMEAIEFLNKCKNSQFKVIAHALREFREKYQLDSLDKEEMKEFIKRYDEYIKGNSPNGIQVNLQKSLALIGAGSPATKVPMPATVSVAPQTETVYSEAISKKKSQTYSDVQETQEQRENTRTSLVDDNARSKMNKAMAMFQQQ